MLSMTVCVQGYQCDGMVVEIGPSCRVVTKGSIGGAFEEIHLPT
jgi:hypothetical protein